MFKIYWTDFDGNPQSKGETDLGKALAITNNLRDYGYHFVTMVSENPNQVGKAGVDSIKDGKCPDGVPYDWSKSDRAGKSKKNDKIITNTDY